jgi:hypothetical protein
MHGGELQNFTDCKFRLIDLRNCKFLLDRAGKDACGLAVAILVRVERLASFRYQKITKEVYTDPGEQLINFKFLLPASHIIRWILKVQTLYTVCNSYKTCDKIEVVSFVAFKTCKRNCAVYLYSMNSNYECIENSVRTWQSGPLLSLCTYSRMTKMEFDGNYVLFFLNL